MNAKLNLGWLVSCVLLGGSLGVAVKCQTPASHVMVDSGQDCSTCHQSEFASATQPLHVGVISDDCEQCHSNTRWAPARGSDHSWPLGGAHATTRCASCHEGTPAVYEGTPGECVACHGDERTAIVSPSHDDFSEDCTSCHSTDAWQPASLDHEWPLEGAHARVNCSDCHVGQPPVYEGTPSACFDCHQDDREAVLDPSHDGFSQNCEECHQSEAWRPAAFVEHEWPLEGAHAQAVCASCHTGDPPVYDGTNETCLGCHQEDLARAQVPPHNGFSEDCGSCHDSANWGSATFEHQQFVLAGAHLTAECLSCHTGEPPVFVGTASECLACHQDDRDSVTEPAHDGFSDDCSTCHGSASWDGAAFEHDNGFPLTGAHEGADCGQCHTGSPTLFAGTPSECVDCHLADFTASPFSGHDAFPTTCQNCHSTSGWTPASGGHPENRFSTRGDHNYACNECHNPSLGPNGAGNADCVGCHEGEHTLARMANEHNDVGNYPRGQTPAPNFCLQCHPSGRE